MLAGHETVDKAVSNYVPYPMTEYPIIIVL